MIHQTADHFLATQDSERVSLERQMAQDVEMVVSLKAELGNETSFQVPPCQNLLARIESLQSMITGLRADKAARLEVLGGLRRHIYSMSNRMSMDVKPQFQSLDGPLPPKREQDFLNEVNSLEAEQHRRYNSLQAALDDSAKLLKQLEIVPSTNIDRAAVGDAAALEDLGLSMATMEAASARRTDLTEEKTLREEKLKTL